MSETLCVSCDEPCGGDKCGIPVGNRTYEIIPVTSNEEWTGAPACRGCYQVHLAAGEHGVQALEAHVRATKELRDRLQTARRLYTAAQQVAEALADL